MSAGGERCVLVQLPITGQDGFHGVVDLVTMQAFFYESNGGNGAGRIGEVPGHMMAAARAAHEALVETRAEGKGRRLMGEFFAEGTIPEQHLISALHEAIREDRIFPVLFASGLANVATDHLLDFLMVYAPSAAERAPMATMGAEAQKRRSDGVCLGDRWRPVGWRCIPAMKEVRRMEQGLVTVPIRVMATGASELIRGSFCGLCRIRSPWRCLFTRLIA